MTAYGSLEVDILCLAVALAAVCAQGCKKQLSAHDRLFRALLAADMVFLLADGVLRWLDNAALAGGWMLIVPETLLALILLLLFAVRRGAGAARTILLLLPVLLGGAAQIFLPDYPLLPPVLTVVLIVEFLFAQTRDLRARRLDSERMASELNNSAVAVMLSQIQPHFLYNALNAIEYLCEKDPMTAHQAIGRFAKYLRSNMDSLKQNHMIPFRKELEHLQNYLYLEELRFGERLRIAYDIETEELWLPPLTIQPLVENAIRYGIMQRPGGGTVTVSTRAEDGQAILQISDDGVGFDPMAVQYDGRSHIGISNTRERLAAMCGGVMEITSVPGRGTSILIRVPATRE